MSFYEDKKIYKFNVKHIAYQDKKTGHTLSKYRVCYENEKIQEFNMEYDAQAYLEMLQQECLEYMEKMVFKPELLDYVIK